MRKIVFLSLAAFFIYSLLSVSYCAESGGSEIGRYTLYILEVEKKQVPIILDTKTGRLWWYTEEQSASPTVGGGVKSKFKGVTVEGLVYSQKDMGELEKELELLHSNGFLDKDSKGFKEIMKGESSYYLDLEKVLGIYKRSKEILPPKE